MCNPTNCLKIEKEYDEKRQQVVFVSFRGITNREYILFTEGKEEKYSTDICESTCKKVTREIIKAIKKEYKIEKFDIYFSISLDYNETPFFNKDILESSINLIKESFQQEMGYSSTIKYFPEGYQDCLNRLESNFCPQETQLFNFGLLGKSYLTFFDEFYIEDLNEEITSIILSHEEKIETFLNEKYNIKQDSSIDIYILTVLIGLNGNAIKDLDVTQGKFLLKIWRLLSNKMNFNESFVKIFDTKLSKREVSALNQALKPFIVENYTFIKSKGFIWDALNDDPDSYGQKIFRMMELIDLEENQFEEPTKLFILKVLTVLAFHVKGLEPTFNSDAKFKKEMKKA